MKFLVLGSMNYDYTYVLDHIVKPGETVASCRMETACGGKGFNQAAALAKAGADVWLAGLVGGDGEELIETARRYKVDCSLVRKTEGKTGHAVILLDKSGQNSIVLFGGANRMWTKAHIREALSGFGKGDILVLQNEINELPEVIEEACKRELKIVLNPSPFETEILKSGTDKVSLFMLNEVEGEQMTGTGIPEEILDRMLERYPAAGVVLTLGPAGAYYADSKKRLFCPAQKVTPVDTTAAGDTFTGFFLSAQAKGYEIGECLRIAAKASSVTVSRRGASVSIPVWSEVIG